MSKRDKDGFVELKRIVKTTSMNSETPDISKMKARIMALEQQVAEKDKEIAFLEGHLNSAYQQIEMLNHSMDAMLEDAERSVSMMEDYERELSARQAADSPYTPEGLWDSSDPTQAPWPVRQPGHFTAGVGIAVDKDGKPRSYRLSDGGPIVQKKQFEGAEFEIQPGRGFHLGFHFGNGDKK